jgi:hydrogenase expression/formation protein HypC
MCLAVPVQIVSVDGEEAVVEIQGVRRPANLALVPDAQAGDYVLVHAGFAIQKWSAEDVAEYRRLIAEMESHA